MAKKKVKKNAQKTVSATSPPESPKPAPAPAVKAISEVTEPLHLPAVESLPDEQPESTIAPPKAEIDGAGPTSESTTQEANDLKVQPSEEHEVASPRDSVIEPIEEPSTEAETPAVEEAVNDSDVSTASEEVEAEATTAPVEQPGEKNITEPSEPAGGTDAAIEPEATIEPETTIKPEEVAESTVRVEAEAASAPVEELPIPTLEQPVEPEQSAAAEHQDAEVPEIVHDEDVPSHVEPAVAASLEPLSVAEEPLEEPQPTATSTEAIPDETVQPPSTEVAVAETQEVDADDDWIVTPEKVKKNKKDEEAKQQALASDITNKVEDKPVEVVEPEVEQLVEERKGKHDNAHNT